MATQPANFPDDVNQSTIDEIFRALANPTRRQLIAYIDACEASVTFDELTEYLSASINSSEELAGSADLNNVAIELHHVHLPKLEAIGLVDISEEPTCRMVRGTDLLDQVATESVFLHQDD